MAVVMVEDADDGVAVAGDDDDDIVDDDGYEDGDGNSDVDGSGEYYDSDTRLL